MKGLKDSAKVLRVIGVIVAAIGTLSGFFLAMEYLLVTGAIIVGLLIIVSAWGLGFLLAGVGEIVTNTSNTVDLLAQINNAKPTNLNPVELNGEKCSSCGAALEKGATFCRKCGEWFFGNNSGSNGKPFNKPKTVSAFQKPNSTNKSGSLNTGNKTNIIHVNVSDGHPDIKQKTASLTQSPNNSHLEFCPTCGETIEIGSAWCRKCGKWFPEKNTPNDDDSVMSHKKIEDRAECCPACGATIEKGAPFCRECGEWLSKT